MKPRLLDLFCGAGGATMGYQRAGFYVVGVDIVEQPRYCGDAFVQADALDVLRDWHFESFAAIHASPPCQAHTAMKTMWNAKDHPDLVAETRTLLRDTGLPYVIENVEGAPLIDPVRLCGSSAGLADDVYELRRHRLFETNWPLMVPPCAHGQRAATLGVYGDHARDRRRIGHPDRGTDLPAREALARARAVMEMPWANWRELSQAIPPAYTELVGTQLLQVVEARRRDDALATAHEDAA